MRLFLHRLPQYFWVVRSFTMFSGFSSHQPSSTRVWWLWYVIQLFLSLCSLRGNGSQRSLTRSTHLLSSMFPLMFLSDKAQDVSRSIIMVTEYQIQHGFFVMLPVFSLVKRRIYLMQGEPLVELMLDIGPSLVTLKHPTEMILKTDWTVMENVWWLWRHALKAQIDVALQFAVAVVA